MAGLAVRTLSRSASVRVVGAQTTLAFCLPTLPTPLYRLYETRLHFSVLTLTLIFSAYVIGTLTTLLFLGNLSDHWGRRRTALLGLGLSVVTLVLFLLAAHNLALLFAARIFTGLATGITSATVIAWMRDLHDQANQRAAALRSVTVNILGLGLGPLVAGLLVAFAPAPTRFVYYVFIGLVLLLTMAVWRTQDTAQRAHGPMSFKPEFGVPADLRVQFLSPAITAFAIFSLVGFYAAIVPGLLAKTLQLPSPAVAGSVVFGLFLVGSVTVYATHKMSSWPSMLSGAAILFPTLLSLVLAQSFHSLLLLLLSTALGGIAIGLGYRGVLEVINRIAPDSYRAAMVSALFIVGNLSMAIPVIGIGVTTTLTSAVTANYVFAAVIATFAIVGLCLGARLRFEDSGG